VLTAGLFLPAGIATVLGNAGLIRGSAIDWSAARPRTRLPAEASGSGTAEAAKASTWNRAETTCCRTWRRRRTVQPGTAPGTRSADGKAAISASSITAGKYSLAVSGRLLVPRPLPCWCCGV